MKKKLIALFVLALMAAGCKKDNQVLATLGELDSFTAQIVEKIENTQNPPAGVDAARDYFNKNQGDLRQKMKDLGALRGYQVGSEVRQKMEKSLTSNVGKVYGLKIKMMMVTMQDEDLDAKLNQLIDDYTALVKGEAPGAAASKVPASSDVAETSGQGAQAAPPAGNPGQLKEQLLAVLGDDASWKSVALASLRTGMTCDEVRAAFPGLGACDASREFDFQEVSVSGHPIVARYKFSFQKGKLYDATISFKRNLDREQFKAVSLELFEKKWGGIEPDERAKDILTSIGPNFSKAQRTYMMNEWEISHDFPKE